MSVVTLTDAQQRARATKCFIAALSINAHDQLTTLNDEE
jgi:hypothetical protein